MLRRCQQQRRSRPQGLSGAVGHFSRGRQGCQLNPRQCRRRDNDSPMGRPDRWAPLANVGQSSDDKQHGTACAVEMRTHHIALEIGVAPNSSKEGLNQQLRCRFSSSTQKWSALHSGLHIYWERKPLFVKEHQRSTPLVSEAASL